MDKLVEKFKEKIREGLSEDVQRPEILNALSRLKKAGYKANYHGTDFIKVMDPVHKIEGKMANVSHFEPTIIHHKDVEKFLSKRS